MKTKLIILLLGGFVLIGCQKNTLNEKAKDNHEEAIPENYIKAFETSVGVNYFVKEESLFYRNNPDLVQIDLVTSLSKEDELDGVKINSMKTKHIFDCRQKYKYTEKPEGFFTNRYATGKPTVPYPASSSVWKIAEENSLDGMFWTNLCDIKDQINLIADAFVATTNDKAPYVLDENTIIKSAINEAGAVKINYQIVNQDKASFMKRYPDIQAKKKQDFCLTNASFKGLLKPRMAIHEYFIESQSIAKFEISIQDCH